MTLRPYNPVRKVEVSVNDPLEIELAFNVASCGACSYFWPDDVSKQPYGPYPNFDFVTNLPTGNQPLGPNDYKWLNGIATGAGFPTGEIMDGCRKAPIMTIGINPNLTAFLPGQQGASWVYPNFTDRNGKDMWANYAYYYRYRSIYQEHLSFNILKNYFMPGSEIKAVKNGTVINALRASNSPAYTINVQYDGEASTTVINLNGSLGEPPYVLMFNTTGAYSKFKTGDVLAAKLDVPADINIDIFRQPIGYYEQFVPSLARFQEFLASKGFNDANLKIGEDVCQLDMVACASPHWTNQYLGGTATSENTVISNCVSKNAWAIKQLIQTKPAVVYLVGEASYMMFRNAFSRLIKKTTPLPEIPEDGAYTFFRQTTDPGDPCMFEYSTNIGGHVYKISTRLIVTPHFSYNSNFLPQFRMSQQSWSNFMNLHHDCYSYLFNNPNAQYVEPQTPNGFIAIALKDNAANVLSELNTIYNDAYLMLKQNYYEPHSEMASVLIDLFNNGKITYTTQKNQARAHLTRSDGSCKFCVNDHWAFPEGCPYSKDIEVAPPNGFLRAVANEMVAKGRQTHIASNLGFVSLFIDR